MEPTPTPSAERLASLGNCEPLAQDLEAQLKRIKELTETVWPAIRVAEQQHKERMKEKVDSRSRILKKPYPVGSLVMLQDDRRTNHMLPPWLGPYKILKYEPTSQNYILEDLEGEEYPRTVPAHKLKLVRADVDQSHWDGGRTVHQVETVVADRLESDGSPSYLTKWKNYPTQDNTWEPAHSFLTSTVLQKYLKTIKPAIEADQIDRLPVKTRRIVRDYLEMKSNAAAQPAWKNTGDLVKSSMVSRPLTETKKVQKGKTAVSTRASSVSTTHKKDTVTESFTNVLQRNVTAKDRKVAWTSQLSTIPSTVISTGVLSPGMTQTRDSTVTPATQAGSPIESVVAAPDRISSSSSGPTVHPARVDRMILPTNKHVRTLIQPTSETSQRQEITSVAHRFHPYEPTLHNQHRLSSRRRRRYQQGVLFGGGVMWI